MISLQTNVISLIAQQNLREAAVALAILDAAKASNATGGPPIALAAIKD